VDALVIFSFCHGGHEMSQSIRVSAFWIQVAQLKTMFWRTLRARQNARISSVASGGWRRTFGIRIS
jgi:hypothetical protein